MKEYFACYAFVMMALSTACCSTDPPMPEGYKGGLDGDPSAPGGEAWESENACTDSCCNPPEGSDWWNH